MKIKVRGDKIRLQNKLPDGGKFNCKILQDRNLSQRIDPTCFIESLLHHGTPAVLVSDDCGSVIIVNKPEQINVTQQHKLVKIETDRYLVKSVSEEEFNELEKQMQQLEIS